MKNRRLAKRMSLLRTPPEEGVQADGDWLIHLGQAVLFAKVVLVLLAFDPRAADAFTLPKSALSHVCGIVLGGIAIALVLRDGRTILKWSPIHGAVGALVIALLVSTVAAVDTTVAVFGTWRRYLGLTQMLDFAALYLAVAVLIRVRADFRRLFVVLVTTMTIIVGYGLVQRSGREPIPFVGDVSTRPIATLGQPDILGGFLAIGLASLCAILLLRWKSMSRLVRASLLVLAAGSSALMLFAAARNSLLGVVAGMLVLVITCRRRVSTKSWRVTALAAGAVVFVVALSPIGTRIGPDRLLADPAVQSRLEVWDTALRIVGSRPVLGVGPDNFAVTYPAARAERSELLNRGVLQNSTHNWFLHFATAGGVVGILCLAFLLLVVVRQGWRMAPATDVAVIALVMLSAYLGQGLVDVNDIATDSMFWIAVGLVASVSGHAWPRRSWRPAGRSAAMVAGAVTVVAAIWVGSAETSRVSASELLGTSEALVASGRGLAAVQPAADALRMDPRRGEYWSAFATALAAAGNPSAALTAYLEAGHISSWDPSIWRSAALQALALGDETRAIGLLVRTTEVDPNDAKARDLLARLFFNHGELERAATEGERAVRLAPGNVDAYEAPVQAYIRLGRLADAERLIGAALAEARTTHLRVLLARIYAATGRRDLALQEIADARFVDPSNAEAKQYQTELEW